MRKFPWVIALASAACATVPVAEHEEEEGSLERCEPVGSGASTIRQRRIARYTKHVAPKRAIDAEQCPHGAPKLDPSWGFGPTTLIAREAYVLEHSAIEKVPLWVCERIEPRDLEKGSKRSNKFRPDPLLEGTPRAELEDYKGSGYDRGHQAAAADRSRTQALMDETFFLSNMAPQTPSLNERIWRKLETAVRRWAKERSRVYAITGPLYYDEDEEDPAKADGLIETASIGGGGVLVPTHFYKIVVAGDQAIAFVLPNREYQAPYELQPYIRSIDWIEARSGIDFLPELDARRAQAIESVASPMW